MRIELKPSVLGFFVVIAFAAGSRLGWADGIWAAVLTIICVLLHEFGHAFVAKLYGIRVKLIGMSILGAYTVRERSNRRSHEALTTMAGPLTNLMLFALFIVLSGKLANYVAACNLILAVSNLVPIGPSDGLRLWRLYVNSAPFEASPRPETDWDGAQEGEQHLPEYDAYPTLS